MARITIEDCIKIIANKFELVIIASSRAVKISSRQDNNIDNRKTEKPAVMALREISDGQIDAENIKKGIASSSFNTSFEGVGSADVEEAVIFEDDSETNEITEQLMFSDENLNTED